MKYDAFISYSHAADDSLAPALQSALRDFNKPMNRKSALHVFRDKTSLAASPGLWLTIEAALGESRYLLLMASPSAASSHWVSREIAWWFQHRSPDTLLILVTDGELAWGQAGSDFDWERTSCLPHEAMRGRFAAEPLWVDLRWAKSGEVLTLRHTRFRQAVLDIAAPLHGRDKDELDGEDVRKFASAQRRSRVVRAVLSVLTVVAVSAAVFAWRQLLVAERQTLLAQLGQLSAQADLLRERGGAVDASVMLAAEGLRMLESLGEHQLAMDLSLRRSLAELPRLVSELNLGGEHWSLLPDGRAVIQQGLGGSTALFRARDGQLLSCDWNAIKALRAPTPAARVWLVTAVSATGDWCLVQQFDAGHRMGFELWSSRPLQRVAQWQVGSQAGHLEPFVSADGDLIATTDKAQQGGEGAAILRLWRRSSGHELLRLSGEEFRGFSPDGRHFATTTGLWRLAEPADVAPRQVLRWSALPYQVVFSASGARVASRGSVDGQVDIWDAGTRELLRWPTPPAGILVAVSDDGLAVIVKGGSGRNVSTVFRATTWIWDTELDVARAQTPMEVLSAAFNGPDAVLLVSADNATGLVRQQVFSLSASGGAWAWAMLPQDSTVPWFDIDGNTLRLLSIDAKQLRLRRWDIGKDVWSDAWTLLAPESWSLSADGHHFAAAKGQQLLVGRLDANEPPLSLTAPAAIAAMGLSHNAAYAVAQAGPQVHVWHLASMRHWTAPLQGRARALKVSSDGVWGLALLATDEASRAGAMHTLLRWRLADPADLTAVKLGRYATGLDTLCMVSDDGLNVRAGGAWHRFAADTPLPAVTPDDLVACRPAAASALRLVRDGTRLGVANRNGEVLAQLEHPSPVAQAALGSDGRFVASVDESGRLRVFALRPADLVAQACARRPRPLPEDLRPLLPGRQPTVDACQRPLEIAAQAK